jgi:hypothetical protein
MYSPNVVFAGMDTPLVFIRIYCVDKSVVALLMTSRSIFLTYP